MPRTRSAKRALRKSIKRYLRNLQRKRKLKNLEKKFKKAVLEKNQKEAQEYLRLLYKCIDKFQKVGFLKKNTAARKKSRLTSFFNLHFQEKK